MPLGSRRRFLRRPFYVFPEIGAGYWVVWWDGDGAKPDPVDPEQQPWNEAYLFVEPD